MNKLFSLAAFIGLAGAAYLGTSVPGQSPTSKSDRTEVESAAGSVPSPKGVVFNDATPATVHADAKNIFSTTVLVRNDTSDTKYVYFRPILKDQFGAVIECALQPLRTEVKGRTVQAIPIKLTPESVQTLPFTGVLVLNTESPAPQLPSIALRELRLVGVVEGGFDVGLIGLAFGLGVVAVGACWIRLHKEKYALNRRMGGASWNFKDSWASNLAIGATVINAFFSLTALPDQTHYLQRSGYVALNFMFVFLVTASPFVYSLVSEPFPAVNSSGITIQQNQGYVGCFLLAAFFTLWGTAGQLLTAMLLVAELHYSRVVSQVGAAALLLVTTLLLCLVLFYGVRGSYSAISAYSIAPHTPIPKPTPDSVSKPLQDTAGGIADRAAPAIPDWPML